MPVLSNRMLKLPFPLVAVFASAMCLLTAYPAIAQTPVAQAWTVLHEGATDNSAEQRQATMRVLRLIPRNAAAVTLAEQGLKDKDRETRGAAALSLGAMDSKSAIPSLLATAKGDTEGAVVMAAAKSLIALGDERGYAVYYAILTGQRKSGAGLIGSQENQLHDLLDHPEQMEDMAFEQGMGFVPFGGIGLQAYQTIHSSEEKGPLVKATAIRVLAKDPDPVSAKAIVAATHDKDWVIRAAAYDALARRGDASMLPDLRAGMNDPKYQVKLTAAAAVVHLSGLPKK
ncbi:MAG: HEAT repeat domain-containing protein [Acidobacteriaceae bacterium]